MQQHNVAPHNVAQHNVAPHNVAPHNALLRDTSQVDTCLERFASFIGEANLDTKQHQIDGMQWILNHELSNDTLFGVRGGIIADEMGLGKTFMMLGTIISNFKLHTLIVVPPALLQQWVDVIKHNGLGLFNYTLIYHGYTARTATETDIKKSYIVITTYGMIAKRKNPSPLTKINWGRIIYDEAHHMRTQSSGVFRGAMKLNTPINWLVTGTPIQNKIGDLHALCAIIGLDTAFGASPKKAKQILSYHLLRRTKKSVGINLPKVNQHMIKVKWGGANEASVAAQIHSHLSFAEITATTVDQIIAYLDSRPFPMLTRARQICIHPKLLKTAFEKMKFNGAIPEEINMRDIATTSKFTAILNVLKARANSISKNNSRRKLIFCHYKQEIDTLETELKQLGITTAVIDGRTAKNSKISTLEYAPNLREISSVCKSWKNALIPDIWRIINSYIAPEVMILQIKTACEGLNLQHYQEIYFTSPHWNPAVEDQAIARVHRIGQDRPVDVFHFIMDGFENSSISLSLDQYCHTIQKTKRELASSYI